MNLFTKNDKHTYKVVATTTRGTVTDYNYIESVDLVDEVYVLTGRFEDDRDGTMQRRSYVLHSKAHPKLDVRQITNTRQMPNVSQTQGQQMAADDEIPF